MSRPIWQGWHAEDWRWMDQDDLVEILAQRGWASCYDDQGKNVIMAALSGQCADFLLEYILKQAERQGSMEEMSRHVDVRGVSVHAYCARYGMDVESPCYIRHLPLFKQNGLKGSVGLLAQLKILALRTRHPWGWFPHTPRKAWASMGFEMEEIFQGLEEDDLSLYLANRVLRYSSGASKVPTDLFCLRQLVPPEPLPSHSSYPLSWTRFCRLIHGVGAMAQEVSSLAQVGAGGKEWLVDTFLDMQNDLVESFKFFALPERHLVKWCLQEADLYPYWEAFVLRQNTQGEAASVGGVRRL